MTKIKSVRLLMVLVGCGVVAACNGGHNTTNPTTSAYQTQPVDTYKNTLQNLSGEQLAKLVVVDAKFQPLKTIDNFNCQKDYLCGINDRDLQNATGLEFYNQSGQLISATLVRAHSNNFYADDAHLGAYLMAKAKFENRSDITALDDDSFDQLQILGRNYRQYPKTNDDSIDMDSVKKILLNTKGMKLTHASGYATQSGLQAYGKGNSACQEAVKQMSGVGELGGAITKFTDALGMKNPWFEAVGGLFKIGSAFTNGGCDISSQTMAMLKQINAKLDIVIDKQNQTIDEIKNIDNKITTNEYYNQLNKMDEKFITLGTLDKEYSDFLAYKNVLDLNGFVAQAGGFNNAKENAQFKNILTNVMPRIKELLDNVTNTAPSSSLKLLWAHGATMCNPNASGNLVANLALCNYGNSKVINNYLPQVVASEQILNSIESFVQTTRANESDSNALDSILPTQIGIDSIKEKETVPFAIAITEHYKNTDNWGITIDGKAPGWLEFIDSIITAGESENLACSVDDVTIHASQDGTTALVNCTATKGTNSYVEGSRVVDNQTLTNIQRSFGKYGRKFDYITMQHYIGIMIDPGHLVFTEDLPLGKWRDSCDLDDTSMIGPREPLFNDHRMILKTKCKSDWDGYVYLDLKALHTDLSGPDFHRSPHDYKLNSYAGYPARDNVEKMTTASAFIPKGDYLDWCIVDHIRTYQHDGKTYAHQIVSCWDEKEIGSRSGKRLSRLTQHEIRYVLDNNNPVNKIICSINSDYHNQLTCNDKYITTNTFEMVDSHQLLSYGKIAYIYDDGRTVDHAHHYSHLGAETWFDLGDDYLEQTFNSNGDFHEIYSGYNSWFLMNDRRRNYERLYASITPNSNYAKFFNAVEKVQDVKSESDVIQ